MDYKEHVNSRFVSRVLSYSLRTNQAIGVHQIGDFERGLLDYQKHLITEANISQWRGLIEACQRGIETIKAQYLAGDISGDLAKRKADTLNRMVGIARENLGISNGE